MATRSTRLAAVSNIPLGAVTLYTVPSGRTTIVKDVTYSMVGGSAASINLQVSPAGGSAISIHYDAAVTPPAVVRFQTWTVLESGDSLYVSFGNAGCAIYISGTELVDS